MLKTGNCTTSDASAEIAKVLLSSYGCPYSRMYDDASLKVKTRFLCEKMTFYQIYL